LVPDADGPVWHTLSADRVLAAEEVDEQRGLSSAEAAGRTQRFGPNKFDAAKTEPRWRAFLRQYADPMQIVLLVAGVVSLYPLKEAEQAVKTPLTRQLGKLTHQIIGTKYRNQSCRS
jgi:Ca2+-transporting ATPase